ncbi:hypothetical protein [Pseudaquabacterium pictum]|uniref:Uncharacterized protein n=1 Tax=Pseudaquabacterium pictum TaxID=2315236 RepID=A0A480AN29_9BURK|nr:hypothetical protein [Rubrivivax pictus]GCL63069.1 hypothetical protein AQPW35_21500 [Rubrivivax pictus]
MIVSHFELIFKPQAPGPAAGVNVDRVVQGYFLEITNLEDQPYRYALEFVVSPADPTRPERSLAGNCIYFVDTPPGTDNQSGVLNGGVSATVFRPSRGSILVPPKGTALVAVLPSVFGNAFDPTPLLVPNFEVRGHVVIKLPAVFPPGPPFSLFTVPQAAAPVKVLLTPQSRATFFSAANTITSQLQATLPLASGAAVVSLPPEPGGPLVLQPFEVSRIDVRLRDALAGLESSPAEMLALLVGGLQADAAALSAFNAALKDGGIPYALEARKRAGA